LTDFLKSRIRGQDHAVSDVAAAVQAAELGFVSEDKPKASFLMLGPTGVGKTETALTLAEFLYGSRNALARFDCAEYNVEKSVEELIGESRDRQGILGDVVDEIPKGGLLLFDEIEKAHDRVKKLFLGILDAARITMSTNETKDLSRFYIILTSNLGAANAARMEGVPYSTIARTMTNAAKEHFSREQFARFNYIVCYNRLPFAIQAEICTGEVHRQIAIIQTALRERLAVDLTISYDTSAIRFLLSKGFTRELGARPLKQAVRAHLGSTISQFALQNEARIRGKAVHLQLSAPSNLFQVIEVDEEERAA
jgi:ATP-dependent Clp protease ATP-binding subunit ClpB